MSDAFKSKAVWRNSSLFSSTSFNQSPAFFFICSASRRVLLRHRSANSCFFSKIFTGYLKIYPPQSIATDITIKTHVWMKISFLHRRVFVSRTDHNRQSIFGRLLKSAGAASAAHCASVQGPHSPSGLQYPCQVF